MRIASWNVNSLKVRLPQVLQWLGAQDAAGTPIDALCLQELKLPDDKYPLAELEAAGFHSIFTGQKTYNGVAILARNAAMPVPTDVVRNIPGYEDAQQRVIAGTYGDVRLISAYFPNGQALDSDKFVYKLDWLKAMIEWLRAEMARYRNSRCWATSTSPRKTATSTTRPSGRARTWSRRRSATRSRH
jgi:exodeoxyribonuclease-3